jgi:tetratricopeptide (TPR) repeat protein
VRSARQLAVAAPLLVTLTGCAAFHERSAAESARSAENESLTAVVAELKLHMRDDTYRFDRALSADGRNVYAVSLWKLDRLAAQRARSEDTWENADYVIEFARGKALERLRRYSDALAAYRRVERSGSVLGDAASERARIAESFAQAAAAPSEPFATPADELRFIEGRVERWRELALEHEGLPQESLAREEAESWEVMRVDWFARGGQPDAAVAACRTLIESHRDSKLFANHLLRLGDLYADAAQREQLNARTRMSSFDAERYDALLDQAFSAYELAGEDHKSALRHEARTRIEALLAYHERVSGHAP